MSVYGLQTSIWHNRLRLTYLLLLIPLIVVGVVFLYVFLAFPEINQKFWEEFISVLSFGIPTVLIWMIIGIYFQKQIIFAFTGTNELSRKSNPELYNIVENLCISRGLPVPKIGIIDDSSMNAFATGWNPKSSWIVFSRGLVNKLNKEEIEAVAGHELTHIINGDVKNMVIVNVFIGAIGSIGDILMRSRSSSSKGKGNGLAVLGLLLYIISLTLLPIVNLAISRKKEYLADAGSVELTKNREAMISALKKISGDASIEAIHSKSQSVASMFISDPRSKKKKFFTSVGEMFSTHPSIESRIEYLEKY